MINSRRDVYPNHPGAPCSAQSHRADHGVSLFHILGLTLVVVALIHGQASAQAQVESNLPGAGFDEPKPAQQATAPTLHVYSRETVIDVLATDDKGQPVTGLTRDDFTIEEDGHPQPIRSFSEYDKTLPPPQRKL